MGNRLGFTVYGNAEISGDLRVQLTFMFTVGRMNALPHVSVGGLAANVLSVETYPDGILTAKVTSLCKGSNNLHNNGYDWLVLFQVDKQAYASMA